MNVYDIDLRYKKGCDNQGADFLSRNAIFSITKDDQFLRIQELQQSNEKYEAIKNFIKNNILPQKEKLQMTVLAFASKCFQRDNVLWFVPYRSKKDKAVIFAPYLLQRKVIENAHGKPLTSHWAVEKTVQRIEQN
jgi:hypothetical protein